MTEPNMTATPARASTLLANLNAVAARVANASAQSTAKKNVRLIAVSKLKPASDALALHTSPAAHTHFGENYLQELLEKSRLLPRSIKWHFIGGLQSNKCVTLARDEEVSASKTRANEYDEAGDARLRIYVQVNTSGEENKSGIAPEQAPALARYIREKCPRLKLQGVMTIGAIARSRATTAENENEDFVALREARDRIVTELGLEGEDAKLELSMGMSSDFEGAIALGSDQVRVGTTIFGDRPPKNEAKVV
ncbi:hypothetical protein N7509_005808 [Penicillium cosmopolitanum]|uniref:Pyridoxal phosphate homeostasis protein n=1 Tax=Penicillium cosmopolitanum TaxID=1131564 RepID=A0A9X0BAF1_9EURO|nr:uncharacterized protein N7509_005808 [Penicillium cosmopolitanum]KAJ5397695.1 hypothetical protein N7509_005808 [Penicillium cosmopolitanum]